MEAIRIHTTIDQDGEIHLDNLPLKRGQRVELIVLPETVESQLDRSLTAAALLNSELVGLWADREDIGDSASFARHLRNQAQQRDHR